MNAKNVIVSNYYSIGDLYGCYIKEKDSAIMYLNKALNLLGNNNINLQKAIYATIGKTYLENKEFTKSIIPLKKSLEIAEKIQNLNGKEIAHYNLYQAYKKTAKYKKSVFHLEKYIKAKDSIKYEEAKIKIENLQSKYENEKNKLKIEKLEQKQKADRQIRYMLFIGIFLLVIIFTLIIRSYILTRKKNVLSQELLKNEKEKLNLDIEHKTRELTYQALMMLQKNKLLEEILHSLSELKTTKNKIPKEISDLKRRIRYIMHSEKDWELFRQYFEQINENFFVKLKKISSTITPAEKKLAALIKLRFSIKESASLLNISAGSIKTARYNLRKKLGLKREDNIYDFLNNL
jgi:DNA-binding CsgD family transcriptional regulator